MSEGATLTGTPPQPLPRAEMEQKGVMIYQETFWCIFCLDLLNEPVTIPCGHSYCMNCLKHFWDGQTRLHSCPQCRKTFTPRPALMENTMLAALVMEMKNEGVQAAPPEHCYAGDEDVSCDVCRGRKLKAVRSCLVCLASYCRKHLQPHYDSYAFKQHALVKPSKDLQGNAQQTIKDRRKDVKLLQQEVEAINRSANKAVEESGKMFTELIRLLEKSRSDVKEQIRNKQQTEVSRVKQLQEKLQQEITELKLSQTEQNIQVQQLSLSQLGFILRPLTYFEDVTAAVSEVRDKLQDVLTEKWPNISLMVTDADVLLSSCRAEPTTRNGFLKYARDLTLDRNTINDMLDLSDNRKRATIEKVHREYPRHPDRFDVHPLVLSTESLTGRCYFEVEWKGEAVDVAVVYKHNMRAGDAGDIIFGYNDRSWALTVQENNCAFCHDSDRIDIPGPVSSRIGVYLDHRAGLLSFYSVSDTMTLLHRVQTAFAHPLYAGLCFYNAGGDTAEFCRL